jgi:hypothetical protein
VVGVKVNPIRQAALAAGEKHDIGKSIIDRSLAKANPKPKPKSKSRSVGPTSKGPSTVEGWRRGYIHACKVGCADLDAEQKIIIDALREIAGKRLLAAGNSEQAAPTLPQDERQIDLIDYLEKNGGVR